MENTLSTSSETKHQDIKFNIFLDRDDTKQTLWIGHIDVNLLRNQRDELEAITRDNQSPEVEGLINFLDTLIDSHGALTLEV